MNLKHSLIFFAYTFVVVGSKNTTDKVEGVAVIAAESKVKLNEINQLGYQVNKSKIHEALPIVPSVPLVNTSSSTSSTPTTATMDHVVEKNLTKPIITEKSTKATTAIPITPTTSTTTTTDKTSTTTTITRKATPTTPKPTPKPMKPLLAKIIEDYPEALAKLHEKQVSEEMDPPPVPQTQLLRDRTGQRNTDMFVPLITIMFTIPLAAGVLITSYRRLRDCWSTRHYRRMDFLVDGMYND